MENNPNLGISNYDYHYNTCRCCNCDEIVLLSPETLDILVQEEIDRLNRENANKDYFFLNRDDKEKIRSRLEQQYRGFELDYDQCIHYDCLATLNSETLDRIRLANRRNMTLPDNTLYYIYPVSCSDVAACLNLCGYCRGSVASQAPGFAYWLKSDKKARSLFLHTTCYNGLIALRQAIREQEALRRRNAIHFITKDKPSEWRTYSIKKLAKRNDAWYEFMSKYELTFDEREVLNEWLTFISDQKKRWSETQFAQWLETLRDDDLSQLVDEQLRILTPDALALLEENVRHQILIQSVEPQCLPPQPNNELLCFQKPLPSGRQPALLFLNLVQTVRQSL